MIERAVCESRWKGWQSKTPSGKRKVEGNVDRGEGFKPARRIYFDVLMIQPYLRLLDWWKSNFIFTLTGQGSVLAKTGGGKTSKSKNKNDQMG